MAEYERERERTNGTGQGRMTIKGILPLMINFSVRTDLRGRTKFTLRDRAIVDGGSLQLKQEMKREGVLREGSCPTLTLENSPGRLRHENYAAFILRRWNSYTNYVRR